MRDAQPGDVGVLVKDDFVGGANVGKLVLVKDQCRCEPDQWLCVSEQVIRGGVIGIFDAPPGCDICPKKSSVKVLEDPDADSDVATDELRKEIVG